MREVELRLGDVLRVGESRLSLTRIQPSRVVLSCDAPAAVPIRRVGRVGADDASPPTTQEAIDAAQRCLDRLRRIRELVADDAHNLAFAAAVGAAVGMIDLLVSGAGGDGLP